MTFSFHLMLIFLISKSSSADLNLFSTDDAPLFLDTSGEDSFNADANLFANLPEENLWNGEISSCPIDENEQAILRGRDVICPPDRLSPPAPFTIPTLPDFNDIENVVNPKSSGPSGPEKNRPTSPYLFIHVPDQGDLVASEPEYYCHLFVTPFNPPLPFTIPVCGSGDKARRSSRRGSYSYSAIYGSRILFPTTGWVCPESEFFCCKDLTSSQTDYSDEDEYIEGPFIFEWDDYQRIIEGNRNRIDDPGVGTGHECRNLIEAGWNGYDSDREGAFEVVDPADLGIQDFVP